MEDRCVMCGRIIPEGRQICPICEKGEPMDTKEKLIERPQEETYCDKCANAMRDEVIKLVERDLDKINRISPPKKTQDVQQWISVKDRLPEVATSHNTRWDKSTDSIRVLCACVQADGKKMVKEGYCKVYSDGFVHWKIPGTIHSVTHWQYLPQPPKGE